LGLVYTGNTRSQWTEKQNNKANSVQKIASFST